MRDADNEVVPGIVATASRLSSGHVVVHQRCENLIREMGGYVWDDTAADKGEDKPVKEADHGCDALRYFVYSTSKAYRNIAPLSVRRALQ